MKRTGISILLLVTLGLLVGMIVDRATSRSTNAQPLPRDLNEKWEYCVISNVNWDSEKKSHYARICVFRSSGCHYVDVDAPPVADGDVITDVTIRTFAKAAAMLGQNGWEMVGEAPIAQSDRESKRLYFKRRQRW